MSIPKNSNLSPYYYENSEGRQPDSTLAQYNNNPGNIMYYQIDFDSGEIQMDKDGNPRVSDYAQNLIDQGFEIEPGAANDHGVFIKFKDNADGVRAKSMWWNTVKDWKTYKGLTLDEAFLYLLIQTPAEVYLTCSSLKLYKTQLKVYLQKILQWNSKLQKLKE
jgi:hypothetical protein